MARVRPFRAWRYSRPDGELSSVAAPPYDVISESQRAELLASDGHNVVALELPDGPLDPSLPKNRYATGKATWDSWREEGLLTQDAEPGVYVLEQRFEALGRAVRRRAFIVEVGLEPFEAGVVIPHERTLPKALGDRFELLKATGANLSQVLAMYEDGDDVTGALFGEVMSTAAIAHAVDADGVESFLWRSTSPDLAARLAAFMEDRRLFIADGHHRYTVALAYRDMRRAADGAGEPDAAHEGVMMALVNMDDPDLVVLPYHRMADDGEVFDAAEFYRRLGENFDISRLGPGHPADALDEDGRTRFLVKTRGEAAPRLAVLRDDVDLDAAITADHSVTWKSLDVSVVQELVLWPLLHVHPDHPETLDRVFFTKDAHAALGAASEHDVAIVMRATRLKQLRDVALSGETMPQKSTYFYPKLPSGLVIRSAE